MEESPKIKLIFFHIDNKSCFIMAYKLSFNHNIHDIKSDEITYDIPKEVFKYGKDKKIIFIELYNSLHMLLKKIEFNVYYSNNSIYVQRDGYGNGYNIEIDFIPCNLCQIKEFKNFNNLKITQNGKEFKSLDSIDKKYRKKITIINYCSVLISINDKPIDIKNAIDNCQFKSSFYQLSINLQDNRIITKPINNSMELDLKMIIKNSNSLNSFYKEFKELMNAYTNNNDETQFIQKYFEIRRFYNHKINYGNFQLLLNKPKNYLDEYFAENKIELLYIYKFFIFSYFMNNKNKIKKSIEFFQNYIFKIESKYNKLKDENLEIYYKIMILSKTFDITNYCYDVQSLNKINIRYIIISKKEENSIIDKVEKFYKLFISNLSEDSKVFPYLLNIDSGDGYYNGDRLYTFDLLNVEMIKSHLTELFPTVLLFYYCENTNIANTNKETGCISINEYNLLKNINIKYEDVIYDKKSDKINEEVSKEIAINIIIVLLHEYLGHLKFSSISKNYSPIKIINEKNKIVELKYFMDKKEDDIDNEYILTSNTKFKGDSGHYFELAFGKFRGQLITKYMLGIKKKGKLCNRPDLFTDTTCNVLKEYVVLKTLIEENKISCQFGQEMSIEEEINIMKNKCNLLNLENEFSEENLYLGRKTNREDKENEKSSPKEGNEKKKKLENANLMNTDFVNEDFGKDKIKEINKEIKTDNGSEEESSNFEYENDDALFEHLYHKMIKKYKFKEDEILKDRIREKLNSGTLSNDEYDDLYFVLKYISANF